MASISVSHHPCRLPRQDTANSVNPFITRAELLQVTEVDRQDCRSKLLPVVVNKTFICKPSFTRARSPTSCDSIYTLESSPHTLSTFHAFSNSIPRTANAPFSVSQDVPSPCTSIFPSYGAVGPSGCVLITRVSTNLGLSKICPFINQRDLRPLRNVQSCRTTSTSCPALEIVGARASLQKWKRWI